jgi:hypothetical protein
MNRKHQFSGGGIFWIQYGLYGVCFISIEASFQLKGIIRVGHNVGGDNFRLWDYEFALIEAVHQIIPVETTPVGSIGADAHNLYVCRIPSAQLVIYSPVRCLPLASHRRLSQQLILVLVHDGIKVGCLLVSGRVFVSNMTVIPCQGEANESQTVHSGLSRVQYRRHWVALTVRLLAT